MNKEREVEHPQNDGGQQEGIQPVETAEEYQARWDDNLAFVTKEMNALYDPYGEGILQRKSYDFFLNIHTRVLQEDKTKDRDEYFKFFRNPIVTYSDGRRERLPNLRKRQEETERLGGDRNAAGKEVEVVINQKLDVQAMMDIRQLESRKEEPRVRLMMENFHLEHDKGAEAREGEEDWVMID